MKIDIYLRKSRADEELEKKHGQGETLARHRKALLKLCKENQYTIVNIHEELVSGEELFFRPAMLELLKDVESKVCEGVLVMDIQRLGRGDMEEQGLILKTFKKANVKIITPQKVYNLNNEFDEEYSEFEAFMSRKEYKMINRRMQGGRVRSVEEGNYIATDPPYGYDILKVDKHTRTLVPNLHQSEVVKLIFDMYVNKNMGGAKIATELNSLNIKSYKSGDWERSAILNIIKNPSYMGNVVWKKKCIRKSKSADKKRVSYIRPKEDWIVSKGKHDPIIDIELFNKAQVIISKKYHVPYQIQNGMVNPLSGLVICGICGAKMNRRPYTHSEAYIICENKCGIKSNRFSTVELKLFDELKLLLEYLELNADNKNHDIKNKEIDSLEKKLKLLQSEQKALEQQKLKIYDLLEQNVYDVRMFTERNTILSEKYVTINQSIENCEEQIRDCKTTQNSTTECIEKIRHILTAYPSLKNVEDKNKLLKCVLNKIIYYKEKSWEKDNFNLTLHHKIL